MTLRLLALASIAALTVPLVACTGASGDDDDSTPEPGLCDGVTVVEGTGIELSTFATGLSSPLHLTHAGDGTHRVFVVEQGGVIKSFSESGELLDDSWLDISDRVVTGFESGLLSVAFHPDFAANGKVYVNYTAGGSGPTIVSEFTVSRDTAVDGPDVSSERVLLNISQPAANHNGGLVAFGPDGYLYIGMGDGGGGGDTFGNGQDQTSFHAKILRIDVDNGDPYAIPEDNPWAGDPQFVEEMFIWGLRNPWRFSWDRETGDLYVADVGQDDWEEISVLEIGANGGWPLTEGNNCFTPGCDLSSYDNAIFEYSHGGGPGQGISITGGHVYRGCAMPDLHGVYFFSDYPYVAQSPLWSIRWDGGASAEPGPVNIENINLLVSSLGEDERGEIYVVDHGGSVRKIVPSN
jgi:glucose/arabinose dehydrogenase